MVSIQSNVTKQKMRRIRKMWSTVNRKAVNISLSGDGKDVETVADKDSETPVISMVKDLQEKMIIKIYGISEEKWKSFFKKLTF